MTCWKKTRTVASLWKNGVNIKHIAKVFQLVLRFGGSPDGDSVRCYSILVHGHFDLFCYNK